MQQSSSRRGLGWPVYLVAGLIVVFLALFVFELVTFDESGTEGPASLDLSEDAVEALVRNGNPENGAELVQEFTCATCHIEGAENGIAPPFEGLGIRAAGRVPDLSPEMYIFRSIVHPTEYLVPGFSPSMPQDFDDRMSAEQIGDVVAYLLQQ